MSNINDKNIILTSNKENIEADGVSSVEIMIEIPYNSKETINKIFLKTSKGKFENDKKEIELIFNKAVINGSDKKIAKTNLISSQKVEEVLIEAQIGDIIKSKQIKFIRAFPQKIKTDLPSLTISYGYQTLVLTTKLSRDIGKPSLATKATLSAVDSFGNPIGQFLNYSEDVSENGILTNSFSLGTTNCNCQNVYIVSETKSSENEIIRDTVKLKIN